MQREDVVPSGYDEEERYFHQKEMELLRQKREQLDAARRAREAETRKHTHWMKCPKCGADLREVELEGVKVDRCTECEGVFFDKGEVELLLQVQKGGVLKSLRKLFQE